MKLQTNFPERVYISTSVSTFKTGLSLPRNTHALCSRYLRLRTNIVHTRLTLLQKSHLMPVSRPKAWDDTKFLQDDPFKNDFGREFGRRQWHGQLKRIEDNNHLIQKILKENKMVNVVAGYS